MKRILFVTEACYLATGYARYAKGLLTKLHESGKYIIGDLASYGISVERARKNGDYRPDQIPWKYYPNVPDDWDKEGEQQYNSDRFNEFGKWRFEHTCLDFKPDINCTYRDNWYDSFTLSSPFRSYYKCVWMPAVDAIYPKPEWVANWIDLDGCLTYSNWSQKVLKEVSNSKINLLGIAPVCVDSIFKQIHNKRGLKQSLGLNPNSIIIGTTMRNQKRKLFPDLFKAFARFLNEQPKELTENVYLYCHTYWPDLGWNIPELLKEHGIGHKTLFTYVCRNPNCNCVYQSLFTDARTCCVKCGDYTACLPNSNHGIETKDLAVVYNLFDIYVQYANSEAQAVPVVEAGASGCPVMVVDYSGMEDFKYTIGAIPIKVACLQKESETGLYRAIPDEDDFLSKLINLIKLPDMVRRNIGFKTSEKVKEIYNWDRTAKAWMDYFDNVEVYSHEKTWNSKELRLHQPNLDCPKNLNNDDFVKWAIVSVLGKPELLNSYLHFRLLRNLNWGHAISNYGNILTPEDSLFGERPNFIKFERDDLINELLRILDNNNKWERERYNRAIKQ